MKRKHLWRLDGNDGPALPLSPDNLSALVDGAVDRVFPTDAGTASPREATSRPRALSRVLSTRKAIGGVLATCIAFTGSAYFVATSRGPRAIPVAPGAAGVPAVVVSAPAVATSPLPLVDVGNLPEARSLPDASTARTAPPADLLREANRLRAERRWSDAARLYQRVAETKGSESPTAMLALASLRLEHEGDPRGALRLYETVLARSPDGALSEEARWGVALAERALGDKRAEAMALRSFLARHPDSLMASRAERRLAELPSSDAPLSDTKEAP